MNRLAQIAQFFGNIFEKESKSVIISENCFGYFGQLFCWRWATFDSQLAIILIEKNQG